MLPRERIVTAKTVATDVLVLGAGAAGCMAAIGAREQGSRVIITDKGVIESCGSAGAGNDHYMAHLNRGPEWDSDETVTRVFSSRRNLMGNRRVVEETITKQVGPMVKRLEDMGLEFFKDPDSGDYYRTQALGQPGPWMLMIKNGKYLKRKLAARVHQMGAEFIGRVMVTELLRNEAGVSGAVGFNIRNGDWYILRAKRVVLALGKTVGRAWSNNSTHQPFNSWCSPYNTGSYQVLGYEAGAKVVGLEMGNATIIPKGFGAPGMNALTGLGGYQLNALEERYLGKYHPRAEHGPRRVIVLASCQEQLAGRGPPFFIDVRHLSPADREHLLRSLLPVDKDTYGEYLEQAGIDLGQDLLEVEIGELGSGGNLLIDERCRSTVNGLFGTGIYNEGLSFALAAGLVAGTEAAKEAMATEKLPDIDPGQVAMGRERALAPMERHAGDTPQEFEDMIRQIMNYYVGYTRNKRGLDIALRKLALVASHLSEIKASNYHELMRAGEARHLLTYCQLMVRAALARQESGRGFYQRSDYPELDLAGWSQHVALWQENGELRVSFEALA